MIHIYRQNDRTNDGVSGLKGHRKGCYVTNNVILATETANLFNLEIESNGT